MASTSGKELVILEITDPHAIEEKITHEETSISISDVQNWDLHSILASRIVTIHASRSRLIEQSSYFRGLLDGSFSDSNLDCVSIQWNLEIVVTIMQFMHGCSLSITPHMFLPLMEGALFFGVESVILECETWFQKFSSSRRPHPLQMSLDTTLEIWNFGLEHGVNFLPELCRGYLARNFEWAISCKSFTDIPYNLLYSSVEHPQLTVDSEKQLCEALLSWLLRNASLESSSVGTGNDYFDILKKVRIYLLPLGFAAGQRRRFSQFANEMICAILNLVEDYTSRLLHAINDGTLDNFRLRLTKYSEKVILSGCAHITVTLLFLALFPYDLDFVSWKRMLHSLLELDPFGGNNYQILEKSFKMPSFETVQEVDISKCPRIHFVAAIKWLQTAFPALKTLKASHSLHFKLEDLFYLIQACPLIHEVDLTVDISPVIPKKVSILSASAEGWQLSDRLPYGLLEEERVPSIAGLTLGKPMLSNISKITLEGRKEISDSDLLHISSISDSLSYLNIRGCTLVSDEGISKLLCKSVNINSLVLSFTSFGKISVATLCSGHHTFSEVFHGVHHNHEHSDTMAFRLQQLQIDGCECVDPSSMFQLLNHTYMLNILSLRETCLVDDALSSLNGCSLENLDVSETMVSMHGLTYVVRRNPGLRYLKATDCRNLQQHDCNTSGTSQEVLFGFAKNFSLEEVAFGWGFSPLPLERLGPTIGRLRVIKVGLGASLDHRELYVLPIICPLLESVILTFQVISDDVVENLLKSLKHLQTLELCCCLGGLTSFSYGNSMPNLRRLKLNWVTPLMTNNDLAILTQNCSHLVELSLSGCKLLDSDSLEIISSGWPGLTFIHLEDCGKVTLYGVSSLFNLKAVEDLLLRHNGRGIPRNFISDAVSKMPLLRKVALDLCDGCDGGFDSPSHAGRFYLSTVKISRCKSQRCGFELQGLKPVHKETVVLEWNQKEFQTTLVKERI